MFTPTEYCARVPVDKTLHARGAHESASRNVRGILEGRFRSLRPKSAVSSSAKRDPILWNGQYQEGARNIDPSVLRSQTVLDTRSQPLDSIISVQYHTSVVTCTAFYATR